LLTLASSKGRAAAEGDGPPLTLHSSAERAGQAAHHIPGVVAVHNNLRYDIDDLMITEL
jgi:hypothetical protein